MSTKNRIVTREECTGAQEDDLPQTMAWVRHHDRYTAAGPPHAC
jgi:hypothetical protein